MRCREQWSLRYRSVSYMNFNVNFDGWTLVAARSNGSVRDFWDTTIRRTQATTTRVERASLNTRVCDSPLARRNLNVARARVQSLARYRCGKIARANAALALINRITSSRRILEAIDGISGGTYGINSRVIRLRVFRTRPVRDLTLGVTATISPRRGNELHSHTYLTPACSPFLTLQKYRFTHVDIAAVQMTFARKEFARLGRDETGGA